MDHAGLKRKIEVIKEGIRIHKPDPSDGIDVLSKVGGLDLAALAGFYLGCAYWRIPVVLDGLITGAAALAAVKICPEVAGYLLASHVSAEPAGQAVLSCLGLKGCDPGWNVSGGRNRGSCVLSYAGYGPYCLQQNGYLPGYKGKTILPF